MVEVGKSGGAGKRYAYNAPSWRSKSLDGDVQTLRHGKRMAERNQNRQRRQKKQRQEQGLEEQESRRPEGLLSRTGTRSFDVRGFPARQTRRSPHIGNQTQPRRLLLFNHSPSYHNICLYIHTTTTTITTITTTVTVFFTASKRVKLLSVILHLLLDCCTHQLAHITFRASSS